jgi:hypothetical protein
LVQGHLQVFLPKRQVQSEECISLASYLPYTSVRYLLVNKVEYSSLLLDRTGEGIERMQGWTRVDSFLVTGKMSPFSFLIKALFVK